MTHDFSCLVLDWSPTFFVSSGYKIRRTFQMALHTFIRDEWPLSIPASRFRGFQMIAKFLKRIPAQYFFSLVVSEKLSRNVSTKMSWFQCTLWYGLVQLTISNKAKVAVAVERDAFALMDFPVVMLLVEFCTDPQSCFLAVWFFAIEVPKVIRKFHPSIKLGILLLENGSSAVWIRQIRSRTWLNASSCFFLATASWWFCCIWLKLCLVNHILLLTPFFARSAAHAARVCFFTQRFLAQ